MSSSSSLLSSSPSSTTITTTTHPKDDNTTTTSSITIPSTKKQQTSSSSSSSSSSPIVCHGCNKPPIDKKRMLRCSRCQSAWYHDRKCQKKHYPIHKLTCRLVVVVVDRRRPSSSSSSSSSSRHHSSSSSSSSSSQLNPSPPPPPSSSSPLTRCDDTNPNRGRRLLSTTPLPLSTTLISNGLPLVPPVLHSSRRSSHCSLCFRPLPPHLTSNDGRRRRRLHWYCSSTCQGKDFFGKEEELAMKRLRGEMGCRRDVTPTVLLLRRLYNQRFREEEEEGTTTTTTTKRRLDELISNHTATTTDDVVKRQMEGIIGLLRLFISSSSSSSSFSRWFSFVRDLELTTTVSRLMMNSFGIASGDQTPLGVGLYPSVSMINHSCEPNAMATFLLRVGCVPMVRVTVGRDISATEEITLSYIDTSPPTIDRRWKLRSDYKFDCRCEKCTDVVFDDYVEGLSCPVEKCSGWGRRRYVVDGDGSELSFQCDVCHYNDFSTVRRHIKTVYNEARRCADDDDHDDAKVRTLERTYQTLRSVCRDGSWYVTSNGTMLVDALLHKIYDDDDDDGERRRGLGRAMDVIDEIVMMGRRRREAYGRERESDDDDDGQLSRRRHHHPGWSGDLSLVILKYKAAKIRLFLSGWSSDPSFTMRAVEELRDVRRELLLFYTERCDIVVGLDECLASAGRGL